MTRKNIWKAYVLAIRGYFSTSDLDKRRIFANAADTYAKQLGIQIKNE